MSDHEHHPALYGAADCIKLVFPCETSRLSLRTWHNCQALEAPSLRWILVTDNDFLTCQCEKHSGPEAMLAHIRDGIETATGLAEEPPFNKGDLSKWSPSMIRKMAESVDDAGLGEDSIYEVDRRHRQEGQRMQ